MAAERFVTHGITYQVAGKSASELYLEFLPLMNSGRVELLEHARLITQLCQLERSPSRGGRDRIDHPPGSHDDIINSVAGAIVPARAGTSAVIEVRGRKQRRPRPREREDGTLVP